MRIHSGGQEDYIEELKKQQAAEIDQLNKRNLPEHERANLINKIILKFKQLIQDSGQSLFLDNKKS